MTNAGTPLVRLDDVFARAGASLSELDPLLVERIQLLCDHTQTIADSLRALGLADRVMLRYAERGEALSPIEQATVRLGTLLSDIGKTGPLRANRAEQLLVVDMYSIEGVPDGQISVAEFMQTYFPEDAETRTRAFEALGYDRELTMRQFWDLHVGWTLELLRERAPFPEVVPAAASHHLLEHNNPEAIVADDGRYAAPFGSNTGFDRAEKLIVVLDKYDAARRRSGLDHQAAMSWLRNLVARNPRFAQDEEFSEILATLNEVVQSDDGSVRED